MRNKIIIVVSCILIVAAVVFVVVNKSQGDIKETYETKDTTIDNSYIPVTSETDASNRLSSHTDYVRNIRTGEDVFKKFETIQVEPSIGVNISDNEYLNGYIQIYCMSNNIDLSGVYIYDEFYDYTQDCNCYTVYFDDDHQQTVYEYNGTVAFRDIPIDEWLWYTQNE